MKLNEISDNPGSRHAKKRVGRGIGSGLGKTAGRGGKGQTARKGGAKAGFEGGQMPIYRRLPKRGFNKPNQVDYNEVNLSIVQARQDFTNNMVSTLTTGADNLVAADTNAESANLLALQTRQSLSTKALSLANQADQSVLQLFG